MKKLFIIAGSLFYFSAFSQVGINTVNPQQLFHTDGKSSSATTNPTQGAPSIEQQADDVVITNQGKVGIGITSPSESLDVNGRIKVRKMDLLQSSSVSPIFMDEKWFIRES